MGQHTEIHDRVPLAALQGWVPLAASQGRIPLAALQGWVPLAALQGRAHVIAGYHRLSQVSTGFHRFSQVSLVWFMVLVAPAALLSPPLSSPHSYIHTKLCQIRSCLKMKRILLLIVLE